MLPENKNRQSAVKQIELVEGVDFRSEGDVFSQVSQKLRELDLYRGDLLIRGCSGNTVHAYKDGEPRTKIFALTLADYARELEANEPFSAWPVDYAMGQGEADKADPVIVIYDPVYFREIDKEKYELRDGSSLADATVAEFVIKDHNF